jgi:hypothetical protein
MVYAAHGRGTEMLVVAVGAKDGGATNGVWKGTFDANGNINAWRQLRLGIGNVAGHDDGTQIGRIALAYDQPNGLIYAAIADPQTKSIADLHVEEQAAGAAVLRERA